MGLRQSDSWLHEKESSWLYLKVAAAEPDAHHRELFLKLAAAAEDQAAHWRPSAGAPVPTYRPSFRARVVAWLVARFGPRAVKPVLAAMKLRGLSVYSAPPVNPGHPMPTTLADVGVSHRGRLGGNLRASVFGINDGIVSNASLVIGMVGAGAPANLVLITGAAGLFAGALSMASGEYVSVRSQREMYEHQIGLERAEIEEYPDEEAEELALIYEARGLPLDQAREVSRALLAQPEHALETLAREELGLNPDSLGSPWQAAASSFACFAVGAVVPLLPFMWGAALANALLVTVAVTAIALVLAGLVLSLFTGRNAWGGAARMLLIGGGAGALSYFAGKLLRAAVG